MNTEILCFCFFVDFCRTLAASTTMYPYVYLYFIQTAEVYAT